MPPGDAIGNAGRLIIVDGGRVGQDVVLNRGDLFEIGLYGIANLHGLPPLFDANGGAQPE